MITETSQTPVPPDSKGGLLADQMGLGKSLTMIALIALNTCKTSKPIIFTTQGTLRRLKSTLVVVPYSRKYFPTLEGHRNGVTYLIKSSWNLGHATTQVS